MNHIKKISYTIYHIYISYSNPHIYIYISLYPISIYIIYHTPEIPRNPHDISMISPWRPWRPWRLRRLPGGLQPFATLLLATLQQVPQPRLRLAVEPPDLPGKNRERPRNIGKHGFFLDVLDVFLWSFFGFFWICLDFLFETVCFLEIFVSRFGLGKNTKKHWERGESTESKTWNCCEPTTHGKCPRLGEVDLFEKKNIVCVCVHKCLRKKFGGPIVISHQL